MGSFFWLLKRAAAVLLVLTIITVLVGGTIVVVKGAPVIPDEIYSMPVLNSLLSQTKKVVEPETTLPDTSAIPSCDEKEVLKKAKECTLLVGDVEKHGTGFVHNSGIYLVTNYHVVDNYETGYANVFYEGRFHSSRIAGLSVEDDVALVRLNDKMPGCSWADSENLELAEAVFAVGWPSSPYGESTITKGVFSRYVYLDEANIPMIQTDTPINPGNSGGPLINQCGVVGINTSKVSWIAESAPSEGIGYAISSNYADGVVERLIGEDDGMPKIPTEQVSIDASAPESANDQEPYSHLNPNSLVAYDYEQVLFWEDKKLHDHAVLKSWEKARESDYVDQEKLEDLIEKVERSLEIAEILWDGYTNSKITYAQVLALKQEYLFLSKETSFLTSELNVEGSINAYKNCVEAWEKLEDEYQDDFSEQKEECENILELE